MNTHWATAHFFCAAYMCGIIWFVQLVHYPMLHHSNGVDAQQGHIEYTRRMGWVVMPVMLAELVLQIHWIMQEPELPAFTGAALLFTIWISTFLLQVPCHQKLQKAFDRDLQRKLVRTNWIRTFSWTARTVLLGRILAAAL